MNHCFAPAVPCRRVEIAQLEELIRTAKAQASADARHIGAGARRLSSVTARDAALSSWQLRIATLKKECEDIVVQIADNETQKGEVEGLLVDNERQAIGIREEIESLISTAERKELIGLEYRVYALKLQRMELEHGARLQRELSRARDVDLQRLRLQIEARDRVIAAQQAAMEDAGIDNPVDTSEIEEVDSLLAAMEAVALVQDDVMEALTEHSREELGSPDSRGGPGSPSRSNHGSSYSRVSQVRIRRPAHMRTSSADAIVGAKDPRSVNPWRIKPFAEPEVYGGAAAGGDTERLLRGEKASGEGSPTQGRSSPAQWFEAKSPGEKVRRNARQAVRSNANRRSPNPRPDQASDNTSKATAPSSRPAPSPVQTYHDASAPGRGSRAHASSSMGSMDPHGPGYYRAGQSPQGSSLPSPESPPRRPAHAAGYEGDSEPLPSPDPPRRLAGMGDASGSSYSGAPGNQQGRVPNGGGSSHNGGGGIANGLFQPVSLRKNEVSASAGAISGGASAGQGKPPGNRRRRRPGISLGAKNLQSSPFAQPLQRRARHIGQRNRPQQGRNNDGNKQRSSPAGNGPSPLLHSRKAPPRSPIMEPSRSEAVFPSKPVAVRHVPKPHNSRLPVLRQVSAVIQQMSDLQANLAEQQKQRRHQQRRRSSGHGEPPRAASVSPPRRRSQASQGRGGDGSEQQPSLELEISPVGTQHHSSASQWSGAGDGSRVSGSQPLVRQGGLHR